MKQIFLIKLYNINITNSNKVRCKVVKVQKNYGSWQTAINFIFVNIKTVERVIKIMLDSIIINSLTLELKNSFVHFKAALKST